MGAELCALSLYRCHLNLKLLGRPRVTCICVVLLIKISYWLKCFFLKNCRLGSSCRTSTKRQRQNQELTDSNSRTNAFRNSALLNSEDSASNVNVLQTLLQLQDGTPETQDIRMSTLPTLHLSCISLVRCLALAIMFL